MKVAIVGGGHGAAASLRAALMYSAYVSGVITVADDGGSSGRLAQELGVLPMGDIRNCLAALAPDSKLVEVFQHRFSEGFLNGHVAGNVFMAAAELEAGSFIDAVRMAARVLGSRGRVVPPTLDRVRLVSEVEGRKVEGQVALATATGRINYVALDPPRPRPYPEALEILGSADQIILGPGSLFTSVIPNLLVREVCEAVVESPARKIYVCNIVAPVGETADFDAASHLAALYAHTDRAIVDVMVIHEGRKPSTDAATVNVDLSALKQMGVQIVTADLLPDDASVAHDPARLAEVLRHL